MLIQANIYRPEDSVPITPPNWSRFSFLASQHLYALIVRVQQQNLKVSDKCYRLNNYIVFCACTELGLLRQFLLIWTKCYSAGFSLLYSRFIPCHIQHQQVVQAQCSLDEPAFVTAFCLVFFFFSSLLFFFCQLFSFALA